MSRGLALQLVPPEPDIASRGYNERDRTATTPLAAQSPSGWPDLGRHRAAVTAAPGKASNQFPAKSRCHCQRAAGHCQAQGRCVPEARNEEVGVLRESPEPEDPLSKS